MTQRLNTYLNRGCAVFVVALLAWILVRSGSTLHLAVAALLSGALLVAHTARFSESPVAGRVAAAHDGIIRAAAIMLKPWAGVAVVALAFALRVWWAFHHNVEPMTDYASFYDDASAFASGDTSALGPTKSPTTIAFYGLLFRLFGNALPTVYVTNAIIGAIQVSLLYAITRRAASAVAPAVVAALFLAVYPSVVTFSGWPSSEALFFTMFLLIVWQLLRWADAERKLSLAATLITAVLVGIEIAAMHLARNSGVLLGAWLLLAALVWSRTALRQRVVVAVVVALTTTACLVPQMIYNHRAFGHVSIQSSKWGALNLLMGTNIQAGGQYNRADAGYLRQRQRAGEDDWNQVSRDMRRIAMKRISDDPLRFLRFALTQKFDVMWCDDGYGAASVLHRDNRNYALRDVWERRSNRFYFALLALALVGMAAAGRRRSYRLFVVLAGGALFVTFFLHLFIEVQPRYHFIMSFIAPILAAAILTPREDDGPEAVIR